MIEQVNMKDNFKNKNQLLYPGFLIDLYSEDIYLNMILSDPDPS